MSSGPMLKDFSTLDSIPVQVSCTQFQTSQMLFDESNNKTYQTIPFRFSVSPNHGLDKAYHPPAGASRENSSILEILT